MMKISVIVPIYNVEKQLQRCLESILKQEESNLEIILVNDGSPDNSGEIAKEYASRYPDKVLYFEKENGGLSDARNFGIKHSSGKYLAFVDSDDYITENLFKDLAPYMEADYDMVKFKISVINEDGSVINKNYSPIFENKSGEEAFDILYKTDVMTEVAWGYIYKREFFVNNNFEFAKGLYHEDFGLIPLVLIRAGKVASADVYGYNYVQTKTSITRGNEQLKYRRAEDLLKHYDYMLEKIEEYNISKITKQNIKIYYTNCIILELNNLDDAEQKKYIEQIRKRKMIKNIKARNLKQFIKKVVLMCNIRLYLKLR